MEIKGEYLIMEDKLKDIFENVNNWLKFAEAKNATLIAGNGLIIFGICRIIKDSNINEYLMYYIYFSIFMLVISFLIALISFIPNIKLPGYLFDNSKEQSNHNLLFFGSIATFNEHKYLEELNKSLGKDDDEYKKNKLNEMYAHQIIINSQIAVKKYKLFNISLQFTLLAVVSPFIYVFFICNI